MNTDGVMSLTLEIINLIRKAEEEADAIQEKSHRRAQEIIKQAEKKASEIYEASESETTREIQEIIENAGKQAGVTVGKVREACSEECKQIERNAENNLDEAVKAILKRIVSSSGNN